ncbi:MAG: hypothetical protein WBA11_05205 [Rubrivirga sp.]
MPVALRPQRPRGRTRLTVGERDLEVAALSTFRSRDATTRP